MATSQQQIDFINQYSGAASKVGQAQGIPSNYILSQWALETGFGTHFAGTNNLGNVSPGGQVANYSTLGQGLSAYQGALKSEGVQNTPTLYDFANALQKGGYATDPNYANKLQGVFQTVQKDVQTGGGATGAMSTNPNQKIASSSPLEWIKANIGNFGLVVLGAILIIGTLLMTGEQVNIKNIIGSK